MNLRRTVLPGVLIASALLLTGGVLAQGTAFPEPPDAQLRAGRTVWMGTCRECHGNSMSDAPYFRDFEAWQPRLLRGRPVLYRSALDGRMAADGSGMPPRGGNANLTPDEVRAAVDYMLWLVETSRKVKP